MTLVELGHLPPPEPGDPGIFAMGDPNRIKELVGGAGFVEPRIEEVAVHWGYSDPEVHWQKTLALAAPIADAYGKLDSAEQERARSLVRERAAERLSEDGAGLDGVAFAVLAE
jgi:hypothetical protein